MQDGATTNSSAAAAADGHDARAEPFCVDPPATRSAPRWLGTAVMSAGLFTVFLGPPLVELAAAPPAAGRLAGTLVAFAALATLAVRLGWLDRDVGRRIDLPVAVQLAALIVLAITLAVADASWITALALVSFVTALRCPTTVTVALVPGLTVLAGVLADRAATDPASTFTLMIVTAVMGGFGYLSRRATIVSGQLYEAQQQLAHNAVTEERLRIARQLHDLLGHSLSLIAVKAELAHTVLPDDPRRAEREIRDLEDVARRSLSEVRDAVTSFRQPGLSAELANARGALLAAGVECRVEAPDTRSFPEEVEALLAWAVREGSTNVIRHSGAKACTVRVSTGDETVTAEIVDDGVGSAGEPGGGSGNGLTGLAERARRLGGLLEITSPDGPGSGYRLRVRVPRGGAA